VLCVWNHCPVHRRNLTLTACFIFYTCLQESILSVVFSDHGYCMNPSRAAVKPKPTPAVVAQPVMSKGLPVMVEPTQHEPLQLAALPTALMAGGEITGYNQSVTGCGSQRRHVDVTQWKLMLTVWSLFLSIRAWGIILMFTLNRLFITKFLLLYTVWWSWG